MKLRNLKVALFSTVAALSLSCGARADVLQTEDSDVGAELKLPVMEWKDSSVPTKAIIFCIHGATLYTGTFDHFARHLASEGYQIYGLDMRGFGRWQKENDKFGGDAAIHYTQSKADMCEVLGMLRRTHPHEKIFCMGESVGSNMAFWLAAEKPELVDGAICSSPCIKKVVHPNAHFIVDVTRGLHDPYKAYDLKPHIEPYLSDDKTVTEHYMNDPMINRKLSIADLIKSMRTNSDALKNAEKMPVDMPLLIVAGGKDEIYRASAIPPFMKKVGSRKQTVFIAPTKGHLLLETTHTDPQIMSEIDSWLAKQVSDGTEKISGVTDSQVKAETAN
ncbi:MAG TPA: alpha/beta fold hydrolase [Drouetiella sp.]